jgi:hypothetical protein
MKFKCKFNKYSAGELLIQIYLIIVVFNLERKFVAAINSRQKSKINYNLNESMDIFRHLSKNFVFILHLVEGNKNARSCIVQIIFF